MHKPTDDESGLFRDEVTDVEPLSLDRVEPFRRRPAPLPIVQPKELDEAEKPVELSETEVEYGEFLSFVRPGVQQRLFAELQRGHISIDLELDLHGLTIAYAKETLDAFLQDCRRRHARCVMIIHGKGVRSGERKPVLKRKVNYWLRLREDVLAFCSATRRDGGTGAVYVLLRNPNKSGRERQRSSGKAAHTRR